MAGMLSGCGVRFAGCADYSHPQPKRVYVGEGGKIVTEMKSERPTATSPAGEWVKVFEVGNVDGVKAGATAPTFTLDKPATLVDLMTYHYLAGGGPTPGTVALKDAAGKTYGPWPCTGVDGQGAVKNAFWDARPNVKLPTGTYTILDSDPGTWSSNSKAGGVGFTTVQV